MISKPQFLPSGTYVLVMMGKIKGGLQLGILDEKGKWLQSNNFRSELYKYPKYYIEFSLHRPTTVQFVLANCSFEKVSSNWEISKITLLKHK